MRRERGGGGGREAESFIQLYFLTVKVIVHRTTYKFAIATVVLVKKAFIVNSENSKSNSKTLFYKDCSLASVKKLSDN